MKNNKKVQGFIKLAVYILLVILSASTISSKMGIARTVPFVLIFPAVATFFYNKKLLTVLLSFVSALIFTLVGADNMLEAVALSAVSAGVAGLGILVKRFFITAYVRRENRAVFAVCGAVLFAVSAVFYAFVFGNPVTCLISGAQNREYIHSTYGEDAPEINYTYYDLSERRYFSNISFKDVSPMNADISASGTVFDGYSNYYEFKALSARREQLAKLLSEKFSPGEFAVRINVYETDLSVLPETQAQELFDGMVFDIAFYAQLTEKEAFAEKCGEYIKALSENGFSYRRINFYGGFADEFLYHIAYDRGNGGDIFGLVRDFDGEVFDRYYDELDYAVGWSYGK